MGTDPFDATAAAEAVGMAAPGELSAAPARALAIVTCMDARVVPHQLFGLEPGDVHVLRNAGGRVTPDVLRSLLLSTRLLGVDQVIVVHHTDCGAAADNGTLARELRDAGVEGGLPELYAGGDALDALRADLEALRSDPLLSEDVRVAGYQYDVATGAVAPLATLEEATTL